MPGGYIPTLDFEWMESSPNESKEKIKPWEKRREKNPNKEMKNYNSKKEDLEEEDQRQDERNVIL